MPQGKGPLRIAIEDFIDTFGIGLRFITWLKERFEGAEEAISEATELGGSAVSEAAESDDPIDQMIASLLRGESQGGIATLAGFGTQMGMSAASGLMAPFIRQINYSIDIKKRTARVDPSAAIPMIHRVPDRAEELAKGMRELGWTDDLILAWTAVLSPTVGEAELLTLWRRGELPESELDDELKARGWPEDRIAQIKEVTKLRPGIQDIITQAVREAFTPEIIEQFELGAELPERFIEEADKLGMDREFAERFWFAHWVLPSLGQGFEMFHRLRDPASPTHFSLEDLRTLVKTQDISPFFRDRLIEIANSTFTRVDVRRMFRDGVLTEEQVKSSYEDIGYDELKAEQLTAWTVRQSRGGQKDLTRAAIVSGFKKKVLTREQAKQGLLDIGFDDMEAEFWLQLADYDIAQERSDMVIAGVKFLFVNGLITQSEVYDKLGPLNLSGEQIEDLLTLWNLQRDAKTNIPSRGELETFYERDIISEDIFRTGLAALRYEPVALEWYIDKSDQDIATLAEKEAERAAREQERIAARATASTYARRRAELSTQIAELRLNKAELTLAIKETVDKQLKMDLKIQKADIDVIIAGLTLDKALLRQDLLEDIAPEG